MDEVLDLETIKKAMPMWLFEQNVSEDTIHSVFDAFFLTPINKKESTIIKVYAKAKDKLWHRNGRLATEKEVELGVASLIGKDIWGDLPQQIEVFLSAMTGRKYGCYSKENIAKIEADILKLCNNKDEFLKVYEQVKKYKVAYSKFEPYEMLKDTKIVEVLEYVRLNYNKAKHGSNDDCRRVVYLAIKRFEGRLQEKELTTQDKVDSRKVYEQMLMDVGNSVSDESNTELKQKCETLLGYKGNLVSSNQFVYKIIETLEKSKYSKCSEKQLAIIDESLRKVNKTQNDEKVADVKEIMDIGKLFCTPEDDLFSGMESSFDDMFR